MRVAVNIVGEEEVRRALKGFERQGPFALALAMTRTAQDAQAAVIQRMRSVFDRPTPFTMRATRVIPARKDMLVAWLEFKDLETKGGGDSRTRYGPQVYGGQRQHKRMERLLIRAGMMGANENAVPGDGATLDGYGNMSRGEIVRILSWFQSFGNEGFSANSTAATRARRARGTRRTRGLRYFLKRDKPGRGIYQATQTAFGWVIKPVLMFVRRATYTPRLDFEKVVETVVVEQLPRHWRESMEHAIRTAK